ncbi:MAG: PP2C family protein-serine/threonine phosphatase [Kofleriaceae bacterium]
MAGRASIVGAAVTHVGNVREHNEDAHYFDADLGVFLVCDGMGGHAAGEVASAIAIKTIREKWADEEMQEVADVWLARGTAIAKKQLLDWLRDGVLAAHGAIIAEAERDTSKSGMGTTLVGAMVVGTELVFAHAGDSRAYIVRDGIAMQLTEDHTLLQRLLTAGIDVDVSGDGARFRSMLTNALGIGQECKVATFVVPLADGDRFLLCSDGISEYVQENEVGEVLTKQPSPARAAQKLVNLALERGGGDNATAVVVRVLEAGEDPVPAEQRRRDDLSISLCELWTEKVSPQQRLRALRIAIWRDHAPSAQLPAHTLGDRVAWIIVEGEVAWEGEPCGPGALIYPESLIAGSAQPDRADIAVARNDVRAIAIRSDDWRELTEEDAELGEALLESLVAIIAERQKSRSQPTMKRDVDMASARATTHDSSAAALAATLPPGTKAPVLDPVVPDPAPKRVVRPLGSSGVSEVGDTAERPAVDLAAVRASMPRQPARPPTDPEIEVQLEMEADLPPVGAVGFSGDDEGPTHVIEPALEASGSVRKSD